VEIAKTKQSHQLYILTIPAAAILQFVLEVEQQKNIVVCRAAFYLVIARHNKTKTVSASFEHLTATLETNDTPQSVALHQIDQACLVLALQLDYTRVRFQLADAHKTWVILIIRLAV
jgi:hypothetical protein